MLAGNKKTSHDSVRYHLINLSTLFLFLCRSKSRSVDHGLAAPFDLDSLRSKVEGRFESIDRLSAKGNRVPAGGGQIIHLEINSRVMGRQFFGFIKSNDIEFISKKFRETPNRSP